MTFPNTPLGSKSEAWPIPARGSWEKRVDFNGEDEEQERETRYTSIFGVGKSPNTSYWDNIHDNFPDTSPPIEQEDGLYMVM